MAFLNGMTIFFGLGPFNQGDIWGLLALIILLVGSISNIIRALKKHELIADKIEKEKLSPPAPVIEQRPAQVVLSWHERLRKGLAKSREEIWGKLENILSSKSILEGEALEEIEEVLYAADLGPNTVTELIDHLKAETKKGDFQVSQLKTFLFSFLKEKMWSIQTQVDKGLYCYDSAAVKETKVIMVVGVNGAGKTTTIGKLATKLTAQGAKVVVGACDTFRAAAVDQLEVWCQRAHAEMIRAKEGSDPSGVAYEALQKAISVKADYCIIDTAGRLHTYQNLMNELEKVKRVLNKIDSKAPQQVLLVIDSITGNNALKQAEEFNKALGLTGLVFTKCDGSSKAGNAVSIVQNLKVPITYIGVGETEKDLEIFDLDEYLQALLDLPEQKIKPVSAETLSMV